MSLYQRGTKVEFVGKPPGRPDQDSSAKHYVDKYGVQVGDSGTVVRVKNGWWRVSFTLQDGSRAVAVPMRYDDIKKRKQDDDVEDELVKRLKHLTTEDSETLTKLDVVTDDRAALDKVMEEERASRDKNHLTTEDTSAFVAGFGNLNAQQLQALDHLGCRRTAAQLQGSCSTTNTEPVQPPMNENFGFDEQPTPDAVVADMKKEAEKVRNRSLHTRFRIRVSAAREKTFERRRMLAKKFNQGVLSLEELVQEEERAVAGEECADAAKEAKLKAELEEVKLQLISARTLMQLKDKTIAQLRGEPTYESWGDWVVA